MIIRKVQLKYLFPALWISLLVAGCASVPLQPTSLPFTEAMPSPAGTTVTATTSPSATSEPTLAATPSGAWIQLDPQAGGPGTNVQVDGYLPGGLPTGELQDNQYLTHAEVCWGGCQNGLMESVEVTWSAQEIGHFTSQFVVPPIPWLAADGLHLLNPGDYAVDIPYLDPSMVGCKPSAASGNGCPVASQAGAVFHLTEGYTGSECQDASHCGSLQASPSQGAPGDTIQVQGWAPLLQLIGQPFGYNLVLMAPPGTSPQNVIQLAASQSEEVQQALDGSLSAAFQVPQSAGSLLSPGSYTLALEAGGLTAEKGATPVLVAPTTFEITAAPAWIQAKHPAPLWMQPASQLEPGLSLDTRNPARLAYCAQGAIQFSQDGGGSWSALPTSSAGEVVLPGDLVLDSSPPNCRTVLLDAAHPDSFYAVFGAMSAQYGMPPVYFLPFFSRDRGQTWQLVPGPAVTTQGAMVDDRFGGFWTDGKLVQVLYAGDPASPDQPPSLVQQTADGGASWAPASLSCPANGPCLHWGAAPGQMAGMGAGLPQDLLASFDRGQTWQSTGQSVELRQDGPHELVALSSQEALILSGNAAYPLRYTSDGGQTWQSLALPALPGTNSNGSSGFPGLQMLPDGSLLALDQDTGAWWALPPGAQEWCSPGIDAPGKYPVLIQFAGVQARWLSAVTGEPDSAPLSRFVCPTGP